MKLYLMQHGDALVKEVNPDRPLSDRGRADVQRITACLARADVRVARLLHSGKKRAQQTAELLAASILPAGRPEPSPGLNPNDPTDASADQAALWNEDTMLVGHLPHLARLASRLLGGEETSDVVAFTPGSVLCLQRAADGRWSVAWMVRPELAGGHGQT